MKHFGIVSPPVSGHIHPMSALGRELQERGHRVTYFQVPDLEEKIGSEGLEFSPIGESDHPRGSLPESLATLGSLSGGQALRFTIKAAAKLTTALCRDLPGAVRREGVDTLVVDQMEPAGGAVAEALDRPFVTICNALLLNREPDVPPPFTSWNGRPSLWSRARNRMGWFANDFATRPIRQAVAAYRANAGLRPLQSPDQSFSALAQVCQMVPALDFPRRELPPAFHYVGPLRRDSSQTAAFPWEKLDGRPLVYASLGTLQNKRPDVLRTFAAACSDLGVQLVLSHGGALTERDLTDFPGNPLVVSYAPQVQLLSRARLVISHGGLNTVLDALLNAVPLVVVPFTFEQPAIAARVAAAGAGQVVPFQELRVNRLRRAVEQVLGGHHFRTRATCLQKEMREAGGVAQAARVIEAAI